MRRTLDKYCEAPVIGYAREGLLTHLTALTRLLGGLARRTVDTTKSVAFSFTHFAGKPSKEGATPIDFAYPACGSLGDYDDVSPRQEL